MNETDKITAGDILGIIDYLHNGLRDYIERPAGRPYDDDEIIDINNWVRRSVNWLYEEVEKMP